MWEGTANSNLSFDEYCYQSKLVLFQKKKHSNKNWGGHNKKAFKILLEFRFDAKFVSRQRIQI
jgi:hypothetical protein